MNIVHRFAKVPRSLLAKRKGYKKLAKRRGTTGGTLYARLCKTKLCKPVIAWSNPYALTASLDHFFTSKLLKRRGSTMQLRVCSKKFKEREKENCKKCGVHKLLMIELIKNPTTTAKTDRLANQNNQYTFDVDPKLTKSQIKVLISKFFKVIVLSVNTHRPPRQKRRLGPTQGNRKIFKRAIVTVPPNVNLLDTN